MSARRVIVVTGIVLAVLVFLVGRERDPSGGDHLDRGSPLGAAHGAPRRVPDAEPGGGAVAHPTEHGGDEPHEIRLAFQDEDGVVAARAVTLEDRGRDRVAMVPEADEGWRATVPAGVWRGRVRGPEHGLIRGFELEVREALDAVVILPRAGARMRVRVVDAWGVPVHGEILLTVHDVGGSESADALRSVTRSVALTEAGAEPELVHTRREPGPDLEVDVRIGGAYVVEVVTREAAGARTVFVEGSDEVFDVVVAHGAGPVFELHATGGAIDLEGKFVRLLGWNRYTAPGWSGTVGPDRRVRVPGFAPLPAGNVLVLREPRSEALPLALAPLPEAGPDWEGSDRPMRVEVNVGTRAWRVVGPATGGPERLAFALFSWGKVTHELGAVARDDELELPDWIARDDVIGHLVTGDGDRLELAIDSDRQVIVVEPGREITGRVLDAGARPMAGVRVALRTAVMPANAPSLHAATTGPDGRYRMRVPQAAAGRIVAASPGHARSEAALGPDARQGDLVLHPLRFLEIEIEGDGPCAALDGGLVVGAADPSLEHDVTLAAPVRAGRALVARPAAAAGKIGLTFRSSPERLAFRLSTEIDDDRLVIAAPALVEAVIPVTAAGRVPPALEVRIDHVEGRVRTEIAGRIADGALRTLLPRDDDVAVDVRVRMRSAAGPFAADPGSGTVFARRVKVRELRRGLDIGPMAPTLVAIEGADTERSVILGWRTGSREVRFPAGGVHDVELVPGVEELTVQTRDTLPLRVALPARVALADLDIERPLAYDALLDGLRDHEWPVLRLQASSGSYAKDLSIPLRGGSPGVLYRVGVKGRDGAWLPATLSLRGATWHVVAD